MWRVCGFAAVTALPYWARWASQPATTGFGTKFFIPLGIKRNLVQSFRTAFHRLVGAYMNHYQPLM